jgi:hypothetical protein
MNEKSSIEKQSQNSQFSADKEHNRDPNPLEPQTESPTKQALQTNKSKVRLDGLKLAGFGVLWGLLIIVNSEWFVKLYSKASNLEGILGIICLILLIGFVFGGPVTIILGLIQAASAYDIMRKWLNFHF